MSWQPPAPSWAWALTSAAASACPPSSTESSATNLRQVGWAGDLRSSPAAALGGTRGVGGTRWGRSCALLRGRALGVAQGGRQLLAQAEPSARPEVGSAGGKPFGGQVPAHGRCRGSPLVLHPQRGASPQHQDLLLGCFLGGWCPRWVLFLLSPPHAPCHHPAGAADGCSPGVRVPLCLRRVLMGAGEVGPSLSLYVYRGGAQRRPVPQCPGGANQLPMHRAHVPLRRGPRADAEGHGWCWSQQVSSLHSFRLLGRSPPPSGQCSGQSWVQRDVHHAGCFLLVPWLQQDPCSQGWLPTTRGSETGQPGPPRHPAWPFSPGLAFPSAFRCAVSCAE